MKTCKVCGKTTNRKTAKFCSPKCSSKFRWNKDNCKVCDKPIRKNYLCCSKQCQRTYLDKQIENTIQNKIKNGQICARCGQLKSIDNFYFNKKRRFFDCYCKMCDKYINFEKRKQYKLKCLEYKGTSCSICGYNKCAAALDFHHRDDLTKEFTIAKSGLLTFTEKIKKELDKCDLICANCHRELHFRKNEREVELNHQEIKLFLEKTQQGSRSEPPEKVEND